MTDLQALDAQLAGLARAADAQANAENFPVALRFLPRGPRRQLADVYRYARFVDDVGDEAHGDRRLLLDAVERDVRRLPLGTATLPATAPLTPLVRSGVLPLQPLLDLIEANRRDQTVTRYETFEDLLGYCALSAAPVGRIVLHLANAAGAADAADAADGAGAAGAADERNLTDSDAVCNALQVLEHCQDVAEDAAAGRVYLPGADLARHGASVDDLRPGPTPEPVRAVVALQVDRAVRMLAAGRPLVGRLSGWARFAVAGYVAGGLATAGALRRSGFDVLAREVRPSRAGTAAAAARLLAGRKR